MHITSNDVFISMEMSIRNEERGKVEKDRKIRQQLQATEDKALALLEQGKPFNSLSVADLDVLLAWHQAPKKKGAKRLTNYNSGWRSGQMAIHRLRTRDGWMRRSRGLLLLTQ